MRTGTNMQSSRRFEQYVGTERRVRAILLWTDGFETNDRILGVRSQNGMARSATPQT